MIVKSICFDNILHNLQSIELTLLLKINIFKIKTEKEKNNGQFGYCFKAWTSSNETSSSS